MFIINCDVIITLLKIIIFLHFLLIVIYLNCFLYLLFFFNFFFSLCVKIIKLVACLLTILIICTDSMAATRMSTAVYSFTFIIQNFSSTIIKFYGLFRWIKWWFISWVLYFLSICSLGSDYFLLSYER